MTERIKQLAVESGLISAEFNGFDRMNLTASEKKFADLIIQECATIADTERPNSIGCGYITKTKGMLIKQHFGVEE